MQRGERFIEWAQRVQLASVLTPILTYAAIISGIATYLAITQSNNPFGPDPDLVLGLVLMDLVLLLVLGVLISRRVIGLWLASRRGSTGSRLQTRLILLFSLVSVVPTIIVAVFSTLFFNFGVQSWFDQRVSTALEGSVAVAEAYLAEHEKVLKADTFAMENDLRRSLQLAFSSVPSDRRLFENMVVTQATVRSLPEAVVFFYNPEASGTPLSHRILAQGRLSFSVTFDLPQEEVLRKADTGEIVILTTPSDDRVRALAHFEDVPNTYLLVGRFVDQKVIQHMERTQGAAEEYHTLKGKISDLQIKFSVIFVTVALLLLLVAVWVGLVFAGLFVRPIRQIIDATEEVKGGNFSARVEEGPQNDELATLGRSFNRMTTQLERQRDTLVEVNQQLDARRRFSEAVLGGVSAGIVALDANKAITLYNRRASDLLGKNEHVLLGGNFSSSIPEMVALLKESEISASGFAQKEIVLNRNRNLLTLLVRITVERAESGDIEGYVVTFDDISELVVAQRHAAWAGVARRIAHEIKNPLTPIQLAAERLRKKYAGEIASDPQTFLRYLDTITRHVSTIGTMVEEFSRYARMPAPVFEPTNVNELFGNAIFSQCCTNEFVSYNLTLPQNPVIFSCDPGQITQAIINLCKNAVEALTSAAIAQPLIHVALEDEVSHVVIRITDNGPGFPEEHMDRLTEPYVTTHAKGTGLGLAIVKKIIEDHNGKLELSNLSSGGALVVIRFQRS
jgi:two-component system nitrogen regulation sensor histidine kinase NtrY